ncbi:hypothetical protein CF327_g4686 [Tilletia walkeri]|nr:hypothetical protein CF327_g4686 [Tilletia walkeri]
MQHGNIDDSSLRISDDGHSQTCGLDNAARSGPSLASSERHQLPLAIRMSSLMTPAPIRAAATAATPSIIDILTREDSARNANPAPNLPLQTSSPIPPEQRPLTPEQSLYLPLLTRQQPWTEDIIVPPPASQPTQPPSPTDTPKVAEALPRWSMDGIRPLISAQLRRISIGGRSRPSRDLAMTSENPPSYAGINEGPSGVRGQSLDISRREAAAEQYPGHRRRWSILDGSRAFSNVLAAGQESPSVPVSRKRFSQRLSGLLRRGKSKNKGASHMENCSTVQMQSEQTEGGPEGLPPTTATDDLPWAISFPRRESFSHTVQTVEQSALSALCHDTARSRGSEEEVQPLLGAVPADLDWFELGIHTKDRGPGLRTNAILLS